MRAFFLLRSYKTKVSINCRINKFIIQFFTFCVDEEVLRIGFQRLSYQQIFCHQGRKFLRNRNHSRFISLSNHFYFAFAEINILEQEIYEFGPPYACLIKRFDNKLLQKTFFCRPIYFSLLISHFLFRKRNLFFSIKFQRLNVFERRSFYLTNFQQKKIETAKGREFTVN